MTGRNNPILCLGAGLWLAAGCSRPGSSGAAAEQRPESVRDVHVAVAQEQVWERVLRLTGELAPAESATISTKVPGRLETLTVDVGSVVHKDDCVAKIEARDFELRLTQARAAVEAARTLLGLEPEASANAIDVAKLPLVREARAELDQAVLELERQTSLIKNGVTSQSVLDKARNDASAAESRWLAAKEIIANRRAMLILRETERALAEQQFADTRILAPFDGIVAERLAGTGDYINVGAPLARVLRSDPVRLKLIVPEQSSGAVKIGQELRARFDSGAAVQVARVARLAPALAGGDRTLGIEADIANPDGALRPGSFVRAELVLDSAARTLVIPPAALVKFAGIDKVFLAEQDLAVERRVKVGRSEAARIEVLEGLKAGDSLVLDPGKLQGGARLRVLPKE